MTPEGIVKRDIKKILVSLGFQQAGAAPVDDPSVGWYFMPANNGMGAGGIPDFMGVYCTWPIAIEAKARDGRVRALQEQRRDEMVPAGYIWLLIDPTNVNKLAQLLAEALKEKHDTNQRRSR